MAMVYGRQHLRQHQKVNSRVFRTPPGHEVGCRNILSRCYIPLHLSSGRSRHLLATSIKLIQADSSKLLTAALGFRFVAVQINPLKIWPLLFTPSRYPSFWSGEAVSLPRKAKAPMFRT